MCFFWTIRWCNFLFGPLKAVFDYKIGINLVSELITFLSGKSHSVLILGWRQPVAKASSYLVSPLATEQRAGVAKLATCVRQVRSSEDLGITYQKAASTQKNLNALVLGTQSKEIRTCLNHDASVPIAQQQHFCHGPLVGRTSNWLILVVQIKELAVLDIRTPIFSRTGLNNFPSHET